MDDLRVRLLDLETALARRRVADLPAGGYGAVIDDDFRETGASGRRWTWVAILAALEGAGPTELPVGGFAVEVLAPVSPSPRSRPMASGRPGARPSGSSTATAGADAAQGAIGLPGRF